MVNFHVHSRFRSIEQHIYLDDTLTDWDRSHLNRRVTAALDHWRRPTMAQFVYTYVLPAGAPLIAIYKFIFHSELRPFHVFLILFYVVGLIAPAFMFKRSLMLGLSGRALYFPGAISGSQGYGDETAILGTVDMRQREWPFDIALSFISAAIGFWFKWPLEIGLPYISFTTGFLFGVYRGILRGFSIARGIPALSDDVGVEEPYAPEIFVPIFVTLNLLALYRRRTTGRF
jgi:hypothetical protein